MVPLLVALAHGAEPLLHETFDSPLADRWAAAYRGWNPQLTGGRPSRYGIRDGALYLHVERPDSTYAHLTRTVELGDARLVRVSARVRTERLDTDFATADNCALTLQFGPWRQFAMRQFQSDQDWTLVERIVAVPEKTPTLVVGMYLSMPGRAWFDDVRVEVVEATDALTWSTVTDGPFTYHTLPGDEVPATHMAFNTFEHGRLSARFGTPPDAPVDYWKYPDSLVKVRVTGVPRGSHVDGAALHTWSSFDSHALAHRLAQPLGRPPRLLEEGLAVFVTESFATRTDVWLPLRALLDPAKFDEATWEVAMTEAGALAGWIAETKGFATLLHVYGAVKADAPPEENAATIEAMLGLPMEQIDNLVWAWVVANRPTGVAPAEGTGAAAAP